MPNARLVAVGGLSGSGKSTVAAAIAPEVGPMPGARVLSSDRMHKALHGAGPTTRLPDAAYRPEASAEVYASMRGEARRILGLGHGVVADAVFDRPEERAAIARTGADASVPFRGLWLSAGEATLCGRVAARRGDPSDATVAVVRAQVQRCAAPDDWARVPAELPAEDVCTVAVRLAGA